MRFHVRDFVYKYYKLIAKKKICEQSSDNNALFAPISSWNNKLQWSISRAHDICIEHGLMAIAYFVPMVTLTSIDMIYDSF